MYMQKNISSDFISLVWVLSATCDHSFIKRHTVNSFDSPRHLFSKHFKDSYACPRNFLFFHWKVILTFLLACLLSGFVLIVLGGCHRMKLEAF